MSFSVDDKWAIMNILGVPFQQESTIEELLIAIENCSQKLVEQIQLKITEIQDFEKQASEAATGLVKVDVLEWSSSRQCSTNRRLRYLKQQLAVAIGYLDYAGLQTFIPFS